MAVPPSGAPPCSPSWWATCRPVSTRRCWSGWRRSTTRRSTASTRRRRWCRRPTSSRRSSTTPPTTGRSPRPTRAATCSPWVAGSCWRSTSPPSPSTSRAWAMAAIFDAAAAVVAEAGGTVAGGHTIRNPEPVFGLAVQGLVHPDEVFRKGGARPGDVVLLSKPLGTGLVLAGGSDERQGGGDRQGMRRLNRSASEVLQCGTAGGARRHRRDRLRPRRPRLGGRRAQRRAPGRSTPTGSSPTPVRSRRPSAACARAATPATASTSPGTSTRLPRRRSRRSCFDPQTSGGLLAAVDPSPLCPTSTASGGSARSRPARRPLVVRDERRTVRRARLQEAGADAGRPSASCGTSATRSSSGSTRSVAAPGPGR